MSTPDLNAGDLPQLAPVRPGHRPDSHGTARDLFGHELNQPDPAEIAELRGAFIDGYTSDDINRVFGRLHDFYGRTVLCRWELLDEGWYRGNSEFYFQDGSTYYYDKGIYAWLNGNPDAPVRLGDLAQRRGSPVPHTDMEGPQHAVTDDGFHNCALVDKDAESN